MAQQLTAPPEAHLPPFRRLVQLVVAAHLLICGYFVVAGTVGARTGSAGSAAPTPAAVNTTTATTARKEDNLSIVVQM